jgi:protein-tyrosine phosphatase
MGERHEVAPGLWIGGAPKPWESLDEFDVLVLAAAESQPQLPTFHGLIVRCPIGDEPTRALTEAEKLRVRIAAKTVAAALYQGDRVLCTCLMGWNRSALVAACALKLCTRLPCEEIVSRIRDVRGADALSNRSFLEYLHVDAPVC